MLPMKLKQALGIIFTRILYITLGILVGVCVVGIMVAAYQTMTMPAEQQEKMWREHFKGSQ